LEEAASLKAPSWDDELSATLQRCLKRICCWQRPPNWSAADWCHEITAHAICAVCQAERDFDPSRGVPLGGFAYQRVLAQAFTRYRREWTYARRQERGQPIARAGFSAQKWTMLWLTAFREELATVAS
jgi:hypothetical protein